MSGVFRSTSLNNTSHSTPQKRYSFGAFCTSPSTLRDVTMEHSYMRRSSSSMSSSSPQESKQKLFAFKRNSQSPPSDFEMSADDGVGFPCVSLQGHGTTSPPVQGRSVREFEEQMASLRKENFNLKLRLYFLEESVPGYHHTNQENQESLMKQLIDAKVEIEVLRKELEEKQELLKEAAQAMNHMEQIQKETESKGQAYIEELKQKIQFLEMEREMDKSDHSGFMNDLLGRSDISGNVNALQKIRELEGMVAQSEETRLTLQTQYAKLEETVTQRDETIKEYEDKVKELAFQNAELQEILENKERDVTNLELNLKSLRLNNADLKDDNRQLIDALKATQDNYRKEFSNMKVCETRMREQQDVLCKMQSTISIKSENTARLLERLQDYEKMVTKMNFERNLAKRENRFFRAIIGKLQRRSSNKSECFTIEKEEIYKQYNHEYDVVEKPVDCNKHCDAADYHDMLKAARGDYHAEYLLKQKLRVNYSNNNNKMEMEKCEQSCGNILERSRGTGKATLAKRCYAQQGGCSGQHHHHAHPHRCGICGGVGADAATDGFTHLAACDELGGSGSCDHAPPEFPIRYTIGDASMFLVAGCGRCGSCGGDCTSRTNSCTSLQANFSTSSICGGCCSEAVQEKEAEELVCLPNDRRAYAQLEVREKKVELANKLCELDDTQEELKKLGKGYDIACRKVQQLLQNEKKQKKDANAAGGLSPCAVSDTEVLHVANVHAHQQQCDRHESTIKRLEAEVKKKTADLQKLINTELCQKNREIERLTKLLNANANSSLGANTSRLQLETLQLQPSYTERDFAKALEYNKLLQRKVEVLTERVISERRNDAQIEQLRQEAREARNEVVNAETCRRAYSKVFVLLSNRLYELAGFLNSLMKHKEVLSFLSTERRRAMRTAVDCSLDLSTSIRETLSTGGDQSFENLSNLSRLLGEDNIIDGDDIVEMVLEEAGDASVLANKTFNSHEHLRGTRHSVDVCGLRSGKFLKSPRSSAAGIDAAATKDAKERRSLPPPSGGLLGDMSESEAWSEPDRQVSMARIGLEDAHAIAAAGATSCTATKDTTRECDDSESESDAALQQSRATKLRQHERIAQLEKLIAQRDERILKIQFQLVEADNSLKKETLHALALTEEIEQLRQRNEELLADVITIGTDALNGGTTAANESALLNTSLLQRQIDEKTRTIEQLQTERERITIEARLAEVQVAALKADIDDITQKYEIKLQLASEKERQRLDALKAELEQLMAERLREQERVHKEALTREWIARATYDECHAQLVEAQRNIDYLTDAEQELKQTLITSEMEMRALKKQLDESVLQASKVVTERAKLCNEKLQLEVRLMEVQQQLSAAETQHASTMKRVSELESMQSVLKEQLQAAQAQAAEAEAKAVSRSLNASDVSQSGYGTEADEAAQKTQAKAKPVNVKRESNSSPDLGIHSDTAATKTAVLSSKRPQKHSSSSDLGIDSGDMGRVKKESTTSRTINDTDDSSNTENKMSLLNTPNANGINGANSTSPAAAAAKHDCFKVEQENAELRRKLVQTKRAFEETYKKLHMSNQRKECFEKEIKDQILKTKNVLKYASFHMAKMQQQPSTTTTATKTATSITNNTHQQQQHQAKQAQVNDERNVTTANCQVENVNGASTSKASGNATFH